MPIKQASFRGSKANKVNIYVLYAWQKLCEHLTKDREIEGSYDVKRLETQYNDIKKAMFLSADDMIIELKKIFSKCGIVFEVVRHFAGAPVQGFIQKQGDKVILCMTIRQAFSDIFWFTLFHEIGHLTNNNFTNQYIDYQFVENEDEKAADEFARNILINQKEYEKFIEKGVLSFTDIKKFADSQNVRPGIVIGRIQNDTKNYSFMNKYKEKYQWNN